MKVSPHDDDAVATVTTRLGAVVRDAVREALREERSGAAPVEWLDSAGAARLLGVHPRTVTKLAKSGELPGRRVGRLGRFRAADVEAHLARATAPGDPGREMAPRRGRARGPATPAREG